MLISFENEARDYICQKGSSIIIDLAHKVGNDRLFPLIRIGKVYPLHIDDYILLDVDGICIQLDTKAKKNFSCITVGVERFFLKRILVATKYQEI